MSIARSVISVTEVLATERPAPDRRYAANAVSRAMAFLLRAQRPSGELATYQSAHLDMSDSHYAASPFVTGMAVLALSEIESQASREICDRGAVYLRSHRCSDWTFAFLESGIDPDLDDTALLNWILLSHDEAGDPRHLRVATWIADQPCRDGLFLTWIREPSLPNDIDPCVSVNVLRYLAANGIDCPQTVVALNATVRDAAANLGTLYYESPFILGYLVATLPRGLQRSIDAPLHSVPATAALSAIDLACLLYRYAKVGRHEQAWLASELLRRQQPNGGWPSWAAFRAYNYWGSPGLTTALASQALHAFFTGWKWCD